MRAKNEKIVVPKKKYKTTLGDKIFVCVNTIIMVLFVIVTLYPILNTLAISFNDGTDALRGGIYLWPRKFTLDNYATVLQRSTMLTALKISVLRTVIATLLQLSVTALLAYVLSRKNFILAKPVSFLYVVTMYVNGGLNPHIFAL